jgi:hypothetical protein
MIVLPDVRTIDAVLSFDPAARTARGHATVRFTSGEEPGEAVLDLRQPVDSARLDGELVAFDATDLGGGPDSAMRVIGRPLEPHTDHVFEVEYAIGTAAAEGALPLDWTTRRPGIVFDLWMSDLAPGRYLESYVPAPLIQDQFALTLTIEGLVDHVVLANGHLHADGMTVRYPDRYTALSHLLVVAPEERVESIDRDGVLAWKLAGPEIDLAECHAATVSHLANDAVMFGAFSHAAPFCLYVWGTSRGMEYDGGTTTSPGAIEHETFHSWFGRGLKPATASDGWIDEAFTTWFTSGPPRPRQWTQPFDMAEPAAVLRPAHPYARFTPREAYTAGARFFAGLADLLGGPEELVAAMRSWYALGSPRLITTDELQSHLAEAAGRDLGPVFARFVHGREGD